MKLKKLEITGFKSFKDKVVFDFSDGISGVVGPNGCGKSNIIDALRWIMGEQNARLLRGKKMEDVIFAGSQDSAPINMAEVTMILANDGINFPSEYAEFSEVMVSRRVFREAESEYYINKVPCRLLDIREFFMDTGVGSRTYSMVEQNSVMSYAEAKPEERRQYIEEAAGITKYKSRKEAAVRKMESTKQNILRLSDIIREVKTQFNSVTRQAKRAEKYKVMKQDIKDAELALSLESLAELMDRLQSARDRLEGLNADEAQFRTQLQDIEAAIEEIKNGLLDHEEIRLQEKLYHLKNEINSKEQGIAFSKKKLSDLTIKKQKNETEVKLLRERNETTAGEIETLSLMVDESAVGVERLRDEISRIQGVSDTDRAQEHETHNTLEEKKKRQIALAADHARLKNALLSLESGIEDFRKRAEKDSREIEENNTKIQSIEETLDALNADLQSDFDCLEMTEERERVIRHDLEAAKNNLKAADLKISSIKDDLGKKSARLLSLKEFQDSYEWCNEGARSILKANEEARLSCSGIYGLVADHISVPREYETAVEAVLGEKLQYLVVKEAEDGIKAIDYLRSSAAGRGSFVPLEVRNNLNGLSSIGRMDGVTKLIDKINVQDDFKPIADYLLGDALLIANLNTGISLWRRNGFSGTMVTPDGDLISQYGVLTGGNGGNGDSGLLKNKREISELHLEIEQLTKSLDSETAGRDRIETNMGDWEDDLQEVRSEMRDLEIKVNSKKKDIERFENEMKWIEQRLDVLLFNRENLNKEEQQAGEKIRSYQSELSANEVENVGIATEIASLTQMWGDLRSRLESVDKDLTEKRILLASVEEKRNSDSKSLARLKADIANIASEIDLRIIDTENCEKEILELTSRIAADEEEVRLNYAEYSEVEADLARERELKTGKETRIAEMEAQARGIRSSLEGILKQMNDIRMEIHKITLNIEALRKDIQDKYFVDLATMIADFTRLEESARIELARKLETNRKAVEEFGEVNLLAIEEYQTLKERYDFLTAQVTDLNVSLEALQRTITRINRISRARFAETFEAVNQCFKEAFPKLFPGGKGELRLTESEDVLESGVDVIVQIPGKKTQNLTLLSGGEKSMVAVALIFAIILYRPTPFLILDEVDAALDDSNISLFNNLIKDISANSQIILVTHNKRTMEIADNLFGITMEKQGISTMVSVNLNETIQ